jgi:hypothetical protein
MVNVKQSNKKNWGYFDQFRVSNDCGSLIKNQWVIKREMVFSAK